MNSIVIPVYQNVTVLESLVASLNAVAERSPDGIEAVFVDDGSTDGSGDRLREILSRATKFQFRLIRHDRNRGSFAAIRTGLKDAGGNFLAVMSADGQEPPELILGFFAELTRGQAKIAVGYRKHRQDPWTRKLLAGLFWRILRWKAGVEISASGVDVFAITREVRDWLLLYCPNPDQMVIALLTSAFPTANIPVERLKTRQRKSQWTLRKRVRYALSSFTYRTRRTTP